ncbi:MAG: universal stress protein [Planctomycetales bacterium]|nr:universal stress protein [Planctomycetales bacterium]
MAWQVTHPVVVPFDFSAHAREALRMAVTLVESPRQIHVLHVLPFMIPTEPGVVWATIDDAGRIQHALENLNEAIPEAEFGKVCLDVRLGDPGQVCSDRAEELEADLIVIGSHGRTGLTRLVLGSVAERVTRLSHCPVLVVKLPAEAEKAGAGHKQAAPATS